MRRLTALTAAAALGVLGLTACDSSSETSGPDPEPVAEALAGGLAAGDLGSVPFTAGTPQQTQGDYDAVVDGMGDVEPVVTTGEVAQTDGEEGAADTATAILSWTWPIAGDEWRYTTEADLTLTGDEWQVAWSRALVEPDLEDGDVLDATTIAGERGPIIGAGGIELVTDRPVVRFGIDRTLVPAAQAGASAKALAELVGIEVAPYVKQVEAAGDAAFVEAIVYRKELVPPAVGRGIGAITGARAIADDVPLAPTREFAAPILGTVGDVTAEMIKDDPETYQVGDQAGLSGLEARYDDQLQPTDGAVVHAVAADKQQRELFKVEPVAGDPLRITLDQSLQLLAERELADVGPASALVAIRPSTGAIVAAANGPGADGYNIATFGQFAPGSTFKSVSSLALLRSGLTPASVVPCTSTIVVDGKSFKNYSDYPSSAIGDIPLRTALANSCNTAFISQTDRLGGTDLGEAAGSLGMGIDHDLGFPAYFGSVEPAASETEKAADMIGQGAILASPMVMATVIASAQARELVVPRMIRSVEVAPPADAEPLAAGEAAQLKSMLRGVVTSGSGRALADLPGPPVIAKTGTAEFERKGTVLTHAWMIAAQGDLAVAVFVEVGESGSQTAGPILESFLRGARR